MAVGRAKDALAEIEAAIAVRIATAPSPDADNGDLYHFAALLHQELGERDQADARYELAIKEYAGAIERLPSLRSRYAPRLKVALQRYSAFIRRSARSRVRPNWSGWLLKYSGWNVVRIR